MAAQQNLNVRHTSGGVPVEFSTAKAVRNAAVRECLLDVADRDYISARANWRLKLPEQFLWSSLQALEKLMKAILLYNNRPALNISHDLERALAEIKAIDDLPLSLHSDVTKFIVYVSKNGPNRYNERALRLHGDEIFHLDKSYWYLRRYCLDFRSMASAVKKSEEEWFQMHAKWYSERDHLDKPHKFRLQFGYLEEVLDGKRGRDQYSALVWKNVFYGKRDKGTITYSPLSRIGNPAHFRHPKHFEELAKLLWYPADVARAIRKSTAGA
jgi:hypothetical protein